MKLIIIGWLLSNESAEEVSKEIDATIPKVYSTFSINEDDMPSMDSASFFGDGSVIVDEMSSLEKVANNARFTRGDCVRSA